MTWEVEVSDEFIEWYDSWMNRKVSALTARSTLLKEYGPTLGRPYVDTLKGATTRI